ncbi:hypothetical protein [Paraburkholderia sediminicola]|uniref:hypothetical protein n=1 Tax=Paraburkholderia sediminicola TaxID=458836 RepID=UPI0038B8A7F2
MMSVFGIRLFYRSRVSALAGRTRMTAEMFDAGASWLARTRCGKQHGFDKLPNIHGAGIDQGALAFCREKRMPTPSYISECSDRLPCRVGRDETTMERPIPG